MWSMILGVIFLMLALGYIVWGCVEVYFLYRMRRVSAQVNGKVSGLVHLCPPMRYDKLGDIPQVTFQYWGRSTANGAHGFFSVFHSFSPWNWYPCVKFTIDGEEQACISPVGYKKLTWSIGQQVKLKYNPDRPFECFLGNDEPFIHSIYMDFVWAAIFVTVGSFLLWNSFRSGFVF